MIITIQTFYFETTNFKLQDFTSSEVLSDHTSQCSQFEKIIRFLCIIFTFSANAQL